MAAVSLSRADSRLDEDPPGSRHLRFLAALIFIHASLRYVEGHAGAKRGELRAYRVLFHPGSRSHKVLLDNLFLLGS